MILLSPLVDDLIRLYNGISFENHSSLLGSTFIRAVLMCVVCDLPATRKVCGFSNFNSIYGCSKCMRKFETLNFGDKPNYGGYNCANWRARDLSSHHKTTKNRKQSLSARKLFKKVELSTLNYCAFPTSM